MLYICLSHLRTLFIRLVSMAIVVCPLTVSVLYARLLAAKLISGMLLTLSDRMDSCTFCGAEIGEGAQFCAKCGARVADEHAHSDIGGSEQHEAEWAFAESAYSKRLALIASILLIAAGFISLIMAILIVPTQGAGGGPVTLQDYAGTFALAFVGLGLVVAGVYTYAIGLKRRSA